MKNIEPYNETHVLISKKSLLVAGRIIQLMSHVIAQEKQSGESWESYKNAFGDAALREVNNLSKEEIEEQIDQLLKTA